MLWPLLDCNRCRVAEGNGERPVSEEAVQRWWQTATVYQIYPRSFSDGSLAGVTSRLDYLQWLGVDALWLSPIFASPMADGGYDVSDYCAIDPSFGTLAEFDALLAAVHERDMRLLLDWVPNHTSNQHPWFQESRRDRTNPKADWYVWCDQPANNWLASFPRGEPAWAFDEQRGQYYLRCFLKEQPDLNWENSEVVAAMHDTLRFWLDRGVDGFRMDVVHLLGKDLARDDPPICQEKVWGHVPYNDEPITHHYLRGIRALLDEYSTTTGRPRVSVGEVYLLDERAMATYHGDDDELDLCFNFRFLWAPFEATELRSRIARTVEVMRARGAWPTWVLSNHDVPRHRQRYGGGELEARMAAIMLLTLPGTPFLYQGDELGLVDALVSPAQVVDPGGRDGCRAPIPWDTSPTHGWAADSLASLALPFAPEAQQRNVSTQREDDDSILQFYRRLLHLRRATPALHSAGLATDSFRLVDGSPGLLAWERSDGNETWLIYINPSDEPHTAIVEAATIVLCTDSRLEGTTLGTKLPPNVALVARRSGTM